MHAAEDVAHKVSDAASGAVGAVADAVTDARETVAEAVPQPIADALPSGDGASTAASLGYTGKNIGRTISIDELNEVDAANAGVSGIGASSQVRTAARRPTR